MQRRAYSLRKTLRCEALLRKEEGETVSIIDEIETHKKQVRSGVIPDDLKFCEFCNESLSSLKLHEARFRVFYYIVDCYVYKKESWLGRWRCTACKKTFTYYPEYCLPYKRYVKADILKYCSLYLNNAKISYRSVVKHGFYVIVHKAAEQTKQSAFSSTNIWRWQSFLSTRSKVEQKGLQLIREKSSAYQIFREVYTMSKLKYRTLNRKKELLQALKLLKVEEIFLTTIFPKFATLYG